jgi:tetratricopeptide (TPR) repeat protein
MDTHTGMFLSGKRAAVAALACAALAALAHLPSNLDRAESDLRAGRIGQAQALVEEQLHAHPADARAHYVAAELRMRQGEREPAREELAAAERLMPGLPFADGQAVRDLHRQIEDSAAALASPFTAALPSPEAAGQSWKLWVALGSGTALAWLLMRLVQPAPPAPRGRRPDLADLAEARTLLREEDPAEDRAWQDTVAGWEEVRLEPGPNRTAVDISTASPPAWRTDSPHRAR